jgi:hypothetical protein
VVETVAILVSKVPEPGVVIIVRSYRVIALVLFRIIATGLYPIAVSLIIGILTVSEDVMVVISVSVSVIWISPIRIAITPVTKPPTEPEWSYDHNAAPVSESFVAPVESAAATVSLRLCRASGD